MIAFAKKTGDYASLSIPDIKVIALTHSLEIQENGEEHIRKEPLKVEKANEPLLPLTAVLGLGTTYRFTAKCPSTDATC